MSTFRIAYSLAMIQEENVALARRYHMSSLLHSSEPRILKYPHVPVVESNKTNMPIHRINQTQMKDRTERALCYYCDL